MSSVQQFERALYFKTKREGLRLLKILNDEKARQVCLAKLKLF